jgi:Flp pilus assembly protein TadG
MPTRKLSRIRGSRGQSLVETVLMIPLLLVLILNAVNFGYFLLVTLNLTSAARNGIEYAIQGSSTVANSSLPVASGSAATTVSSLISQELSSFNAGTLAVQVCSLNLGSDSGSAPTTTCTTAGTGGQFATPDSDPESASGFALNRIDVSYTFNTLIPTAAFNLVVGSFPTCKVSGSCTFTRHAEMRAMGS